MPDRLYPITDAQRAQIHQLLGQVGRKLGAGEEESRIHPARAIRVLRELLAPDVVNPEDFLYLCRPREELKRPIVLEGSKLETDHAVFGLSARSYNCLKREDTHTVSDLLQWSETELWDIKNLGAKSVGEIKVKLASHGWHLSTHDLEPLAPPKGDRWVELHMTAGQAGRIKRLYSLAMHRAVRCILPPSLPRRHDIAEYAEQLGAPTIGHLVRLGPGGLRALLREQLREGHKLDPDWATEVIVRGLRDCNIPMPA